MTGTLRIRTTDIRDPRTKLPARIHLRDSSGGHVLSPHLPSWFDHITIPGELTLEVPAGLYHGSAEKGPEWQPAHFSVAVADGGSALCDVRLQRHVDLANEGWRAGDLHVHRDQNELPLLTAAEGLAIAPVISTWNMGQLFNSDPDPGCVEDERSGGALLYLGMRRAPDLSQDEPEWPTSTSRLLAMKRQDPQAWADAEKPFWWDLPTWVATGQIDSIGLANNHCWRSGVLDSEVWGRPRVRQEFGGVHGNALYSQDIYYRLLNCGFRIPPSGGSASGALPNPIGYNRVYAHVGTGSFSSRSWWSALRAGRCFVTNGPLLRVSANGQLPGATLSSEGALEIDLRVEIDGSDAIDRVELILDGRTQPCPERITVRRSGWFLIRAIAETRHTFRFASTGPFYVEIAGQPAPRSIRDVDYFLSWINTRIADLSRAWQATSKRRPLAEILDPHASARAHFLSLRAGVGPVRGTTG